MKCPTCDGNKVFNTHINTGIDSSRHQWMILACSTCGGTGEITDEHAKRIKNGMRMMNERRARGETVKEAAERLGMTPAQLSAIEHGKEQQQ